MTQTCPECGATHEGELPNSPCPACLMKLGLQSWSRQVNEEDLSPTTVQGPHFDAPTLDQMAVLFPQLKFERLLGIGGMGAVYLAKQKSLDRQVALKIIKPSASGESAFAERFAREAKSLARLNHHNIVTVYDFGQVEDTYYFVMEYVDGVNLREAIREGRMKPDEALAIVPKVCDALQYAHEEGIVHRDIKPENILLDKRGRVKIADFGLAKLLRRTPVEMTLTSTNQVMGTMHYMAPEQLERPLQVDHRADIYSLGVVLYELLTGELPLGRFRLPSERSLDARLDDVVVRTLDREPERRYQQVSDLKTDVEDISANYRADSSPPEVERTASPAVAAVAATRSVPFFINKNGVRGVQGLVRFDGKRVHLEFDVSEDVEWMEQFDGFAPGRHQAQIPIRECAIATLERSWSGQRIILQTNSLDAVAKIPGNDRGRVLLSVEKADRYAALELVNAVRGVLGQPAVVETDSTIQTQPGTFHWGRVAYGIGFLLVGAFLLATSFVHGGSLYLWVGIGIAIAGGSTFSDAFSEKRRLQGDEQFRAEILGSAAVLFAIGAGLLVFQIATQPGWLTWIGIGFALVGARRFASVWLKDKSDSVTDLPDDAPPGLVSPAELKPGVPDLAQRDRLRAPAAAMMVFGILNLMIFFGVIIIAAFQSDSIESKRIALLSWTSISVISGSACIALAPGLLMLVAARRMRDLRSYTLPVAVAILGLIPISATWLWHLPFVIWILVVLTDKRVKREFDLAQDEAEQAADA